MNTYLETASFHLRRAADALAKDQPRRDDVHRVPLQTVKIADMTPRERKNWNRRIRRAALQGNLPVPETISFVAQMHDIFAEAERVA